MDGLLAFSDWFQTLSLVFGGCCSNAITLERLTLEYPHSGSLITFIQFLIISIHGLPRHVEWTSYGPKFKPRRIPLTPYTIQVVLFYLVSLLNNAAFAYRIPMSVHIIFRSGGLIISMVLGYLLVGRRYSLIQVFSVLLVTLGVVLTTFSASTSAKPSNLHHVSESSYTYVTGIAILTLALLFSGFLGVVQDWTYSKYGRPALSSKIEKSMESSKKDPPAWQESMFYLHFLALPMFLSVRHDLSAQIAAVNAGPRVSLSVPLSLSLPALPPSISSFLLRNSTFISVLPTKSGRSEIGLSIPTAYMPLLINTLTQLFCVAGVHRLTTRVSALTVTLVLVVRKAVSLVLSVVGVREVRHGRGDTKTDVDKTMMWFGASMVLVGTIIYSVGGGMVNASRTKNKKD